MKNGRKESEAIEAPGTYLGKEQFDFRRSAAYSGIGINKIREITNDERCKFVLWIGNKRLIKRRLFDAYIEQTYSI